MINKRTVCQTVINKTIHEESKNWKPCNKNCSGTQMEDKERAGTAKSTCGENSAQSLLLISLHVTLENIRGRAGSPGTDEVSRLFDGQNFNLSGFNQIQKASGFCQVIVQYIIDQ